MSMGARSEQRDVREDSTSKLVRELSPIRHFSQARLLDFRALEDRGSTCSMCLRRVASAGTTFEQDGCCSGRTPRRPARLCSPPLLACLMIIVCLAYCVGSRRDRMALGKA